MSLAPGVRLGPYEVVSLLGVGGMGEVYRGRDTRLGREIALKVIAAGRVDDPSLRGRFELEARAASALNHPAIVTLYDVGETDGVSWIAMEWVDGRTLRKVIADGPLPLRDALNVARQLADGLATAHAKGVVHRDLKPENVMVTPDGRAKILDFGLARLTLEPVPDGSVSQLETFAARPETHAGMILGTVGYMSPEQAAGRPADFQSDQFSLGVIAYEMLSGRRPFTGGSAVETLSAIIRDEPAPLAMLRPGLPEPLLGAIATCLAKRPEARFESTRQLARALEDVGTVPTAVDSTSAAPTVLRPFHGRRLPRRMLVPGLAVALALIAAAWTWFQARPTAIQSLAVLPFENRSSDPSAEYLSDGLTESLIDQFSGLSSLRVMARSTVFRFKGTADPQEAGRKLGVGAVLTGTVSRRGDSLSISAELMEIPTGARLWGGRYERPFADVLRLQDGLAADIAHGLRLRLSGEERQALTRHGTESLSAYELLLKGRYLLAKATEEDDLEARALFEQAIRLDSRFVQGHLGLAATYLRAASNGWAPPAEVWPRAEQALRRAEAVEPDNTLVRAVLATLRYNQTWDWQAAQRAYADVAKDSRFLRAEASRGAVIFLWSIGRPAEAVSLLERTLQADPGNLESQIMLADLLVHAGRLDDAIRSYKAIIQTEPQDPSPFFGLAEVLKRRGDIAGALDALRKAYELSEEEAGVKALERARTEKDFDDTQVKVARARLQDLEELARERYVSPLDRARLQAQAGERETALASLAAAFVEKSPGLLLLKVDRAWDGIRDDPRFAAMVRRVGIP